MQTIRRLFSRGADDPHPVLEVTETSDDRLTFSDVEFGCSKLTVLHRDSWRWFCFGVSPRGGVDLSEAQAIMLAEWILEKVAARNNLPSSAS